MRNASRQGGGNEQQLKKKGAGTQTTKLFVSTTTFFHETCNQSVSSCNNNGQKKRGKKKCAAGAQLLLFFANQTYFFPYSLPSPSSLSKLQVIIKEKSKAQLLALAKTIVKYYYAGRIALVSSRKAIRSRSVEVNPHLYDEFFFSSSNLFPSPCSPSFQPRK